MTWRHLLPYGYAPGHYISRCLTCWILTTDLDKRARSCRPCAEARHRDAEAQTKPRVGGGPEAFGLPPYPAGEIVGPCVCGSWPGGKCTRCAVRLADGSTVTFKEEQEWQ